MSFVVADRVKETTTVVGTGAIPLGGAPTGYQSFSVIGNGNSTFYSITFGVTTQWEIGIGTYNSTTNTLSRDTVLSSSNANSLVNFFAGAKTVVLSQPAERAVYSVNGTIVSANGATLPNSSTTATSANTASAIVARDASGNFTAGTITAALSGNATTAGNVTGTVAVTNGGTGATTASSARTNLSAQVTLISGTNIKTVNNTSLLGSGNISATTDPSGSHTYVQYNNFGLFKGSPNFTFNESFNELTVTTINISRGRGSSPLFSTAVGNTTLNNNTTGESNTAIGYEVLRYNTIGGNNTAVGSRSLANNSSGSDNVAVGVSAMFSNIFGYRNTTIGSGALADNYDGIDNTAVGAYSLASNTSGAENTSVGSFSMLFNTTGNYNTAVGYEATYSNTTGTDNTAVGYRAGYSNTTGVLNTFIGNGSGFGVTTGSYNAFLGTRIAGLSFTGNYNTLIGDAAGNSLTGTVASNTFIGQGAGSSVTTGSKNTILGSFSGINSGLDIRTASNYIVLSDGDGNTRAAYNATGVQFTTQATPVSKAATVTLTGAEVLTGLILASGTGFTLTMPTGAALDAATGGMPVDTAFNFTIMKVDSSQVTLAVNTGITNTGNSNFLIISTSTSAMYRVRKTAANTFVMYRLS